MQANGHKEEPLEILLDISDGMPRVVLRAEPNPNGPGILVSFELYNTADLRTAWDMVHGVEPTLVANMLAVTEVTTAQRAKRKTAARQAADRVKEAIWLPGRR